MSPKQVSGLNILQASAGSGKTFQLVLSYLKILLQNPYEYDKILAITFTNKATEEMKSRILRALSDLANGTQTGFYVPLKTHFEESGLEIDIRRSAETALNRILLDYSNFAVSTIESFFQRVIRAFARELDIPLGYDIEMKSTYVIQRVVDELMTEAGFSEKITEVLSQYIYRNLEEDRGWKIESKIQTFAQEMLKEIFQRSVGVDASIESLEAFEAKAERLKHHIQEVQQRVESEMHRIGAEAMEAFAKASIVDKTFNNAGNPLRYLRKIAHRRASGKDFEFDNETLKRNYENGHESYLRKNDRKPEYLSAALLAHSYIEQAYTYWQAHKTEYFTAIEAQDNIHELRLIYDLKRKFAEYREENRLLLISDTSMLLNAVISGYEDAPFVYEKIGNHYVHYLIDEFQDTSRLQWKNLLPLLRNTLSQHEHTRNIIVGDAKQAIYRWRGGEMKLLLQQVEADLEASGNAGQMQKQYLVDNWRTGREIVAFNNALFEQIKTYYQEELHDWLFGEQANDEQESAFQELLEIAYKSVAQNPKKTSVEGYVEVDFLEYAGKKEDNHPQIFARLLELIGQIKADGYSLADITILTRTKAEISKTVAFLNEQGVAAVSNESFLLQHSPLVRLLVASLAYMADEKDDVAAVSAGYFYHLWTQNKSLKIEHESENEKLINIFQHKRFPLPQALTENRSALVRLPLYEAVQKLLRIYALEEENDAFLQSFLDLILNFARTQEAGITAFLQWWEEEKDDKFVSSAAGTNAVKVMTIHAAKGLEFPILIVPFCDWKMTPQPNANFWVTTDREPYNGIFQPDDSGAASIFPLKLNSSIAKTYFQPSYSDELFQTLMDNLNVLYVAFTRPEYRMYVLAPYKKQKEKAKKEKEKEVEESDKIALNVSSLLMKLLEGELQSVKKTDEAGEETLSHLAYIRGKAVAKYELGQSHGQEEKERLSLAYQPIQQWETLIRARLQHNVVYRAKGSVQAQKMTEGIVLHEALSHVKTIADIPRAVDFLTFNGSITENQRQFFADQLHRITQHPIAQDWFDARWTVKNEAEISTAKGKLIRPDRVILKGQTAIVIDYKTGNPSPKYHNQIAEYATYLKEMGYTDVKAYLYYFQTDTVEEVK